MVTKEILGESHKLRLLNTFSLLFAQISQAKFLKANLLSPLLIFVDQIT